VLSAVATYPMSGKINLIDDCLHELVNIQQMFKSYEQLAHNPSFHFRPAQFHKCIMKVQIIIDTGREIGSQIKEEK